MVTPDRPRKRIDNWTFARNVIGRRCLIGIVDGQLCYTGEVFTFNRALNEAETRDTTYELGHELEWPGASEFK